VVEISNIDVVFKVIEETTEVSFLDESLELSGLLDVLLSKKEGKFLLSFVAMIGSHSGLKHTESSRISPM